VRAVHAKERAEAARVKQLEDRIAKSEAQIAALKSEPASKGATTAHAHAEQTAPTSEAAMMADNARLNARMRLETKAHALEARREGAVAQGEDDAAAQTHAQEQAAAAMKIPAAVLQKADSIVKHKVTTDLAQKYESELEADTNFIFSGPKADESKPELDAGAGASIKARTQELAASASSGFGNLHAMEKEVLSQLIQSNQQRAHAAAAKEAAAKEAAARKLALKKKWYQEEVRKEDEEQAKRIEEQAKKVAAETAAQKAAQKAAQAKAKAVAAAEYAKAHTPVQKMSVRQRALAFVSAFDHSAAGVHLASESEPK
jgi:colicin import membrane protein